MGGSDNAETDWKKEGQAAQMQSKSSGSPGFDKAKKANQCLECFSAGKNVQKFAERS